MLGVIDACPTGSLCGVVVEQQRLRGQRNCISQELQNSWEPLTFPVDRVALISRRGHAEPFRVRLEIPLGGARPRHVDVPYVATVGTLESTSISDDVSSTRLLASPLLCLAQLRFQPQSSCIPSGGFLFLCPVCSKLNDAASLLIFPSHLCRTQVGQVTWKPCLVTACVLHARAWGPGMLIELRFVTQDNWLCV